jgi:plastocyanin
MQILMKRPIKILPLIIMGTTLLATILTTNSLIPMARAQNTNATNTTTSNATTASTGTTNQESFASPGNKTFNLFTSEYEGLNEEQLGIPADTFSPDVLIANEGDNITIHFYNLDTTDRHTFTIGAPYNVNLDLLPLHHGTVMFKANQEGVFRFYCTYHQPTMAGQLVVLHPPTVEKIGTVTVK